METLKPLPSTPIPASEIQGSPRGLSHNSFHQTIQGLLTESQGLLEYLYFSLNYTVSKFSIYLHIRFDLNLSSVSPLDLSSITLHEQSIELGQQISLQTCAFLKVSLVV